MGGGGQDTDATKSSEWLSAVQTIRSDEIPCKTRIASIAGCVNGHQFAPDEHKALPAQFEPNTSYELREVDILLSRGNTLKLVVSASVVPNVRGKLLLCDLLYRCRVNSDKVFPEFVTHHLRSTSGRFQIERNANGSSGSMKKIGQETIQNFYVLIPPSEEQTQILAMIEKETQSMDAIQVAATDSINLLKERRSALITGAVTGQIEL